MTGGKLKLKLWGVRGSAPTPVPENLGFGGNTPCIEVRLPGDEILIFDAGTGIRRLGAELRQNAPGRQVHIFFTHFHWDHIHGLPFFAPLFDETQVSFYSGTTREGMAAAIAGQMKAPYFPIDFKSSIPNYAFLDLCRDGFTLGGATVRAFPVHHPQGASGFRVDAAGKSIVYVPDREAGNPELDRVMQQFAEGADILIHDSQYTPEEYGPHKGWGHSTWPEAVQVARETGVKQLILFHHDPDHNDTKLAAIEKQAADRFEHVCMGREGWVAAL